MIHIPWTCPCGAKNTLILDREGIEGKTGEFKGYQTWRCQTCREVCRIKYRVEVFVTVEGVEKAE